MKKLQYDAAVPLFQRAIKLDPNLAVAYIALGTTHRTIGKPALGLRICEWPTTFASE
jgi:hypothetical protein